VTIKPIDRPTAMPGRRSLLLLLVTVALCYSALSADNRAHAEVSTGSEDVLGCVIAVVVPSSVGIV
jgi:hypothetical protein